MADDVQSSALSVNSAPNGGPEVDRGPAGTARFDFSRGYLRLWRRTIRNVILGTLVSVLPAFIFYLVAFSYTPEQVRLMLWLSPLPVLAAFAADLMMNWWYLGPVRRFSRNARASESAGIAYARLHNLPLYSFARVFGPHALTASTIAQIAVLFANRHWSLGISSSDYWIYWLLNLTLVPIGHAIFEYHANGWAAQGLLASLVEEYPSSADIRGVWRVGLAIRLAIFYTMLAISPLVLLAAAVRLRPLRAEPFSGVWSDVAMVVAGVSGLNLLLLLLFAKDINQQTRTLVQCFKQVEAGNLGTRVDLFSPDEFGVVSDGVNTMIRGLRERQRIHDLFGVYLSPEVSRAILEGRIALEGEAREVSVLFCDIRDFTRFSASRSPRQVVERLNRFFSRMAGAITAQGGTINKFLGDGFLAVFGAPGHQSDHARRAIRAALQMESELQALNVELQESGETPLEIGIGIDSGEVIAGNVGSKDRLEYSVIGDPVNRSSRIEQLNKTLGTRILISERTHAQDGIQAGRAMPPVTVKGIEEALRIFTVGEKA